MDARVGFKLNELQTRTWKRLEDGLGKTVVLELIGSVALGCALGNGSDLDFVVMGAGEYPLLRITEAIQRAGIAKGKVKPIQNARVPIVTYCDGQTGISVDLSFDQERDVEIRRTLTRELDALPGCRESIIAVKQWLKQERIQTMGGMCVTIMCISMFRRGQRDFWQTYVKHDPKMGIISLAQQGIDPMVEDPTILWVRDPCDEENNLAKAVDWASFQSTLQCRKK